MFYYAMQKQRQLQKEVSKTKLNQASLLLQKQIQKLNLKELTLIVSFVSAAAVGRIALQGIPSVELITFFAILAGALFGKEEGFLVGSSSLIVSNFFVFGGQGPWTIFQAIGFGIVGYFGGFLNENSKRISFIGIALISTIVYEIIINTQSIMMFGFLGISSVLLLALPFVIVHIISNTIFLSFAPEIIKKMNEVEFFEHKKIAEHLRNYINSKLGFLSKPRKE